MSCQTCPANSYSDATDTKACTHCGGGTTIGTGSTIVSECNCNVGYYLGPQSCLICPRGYATVESGSTSISACDICPGSTYEQFDGSIWCPFALPKFSVLYPSTPRGGTLLVTGGVFSQSEVFVIDKPLTVICQESEDCIFDGLYTHLVLRLNVVGSEGVTLEGITIKGGNPDYGDNGGGIYVFETTTIFRRCTIRDNSANLGGGIFAHQSEVFLLGVVFQNNTAFSENSRSSDFYVGTSSIVHVQSGCSEGESATWADDLDINIPPVGIAKSAAAVNHCTPCVAGKFNEVVGSTDCADCPKGRWNDEIQSKTRSDCRNCTAGHYNEREGADSFSYCLPCSSGKSLSTAGSPSRHDCVSCSSGYYTNRTGAIECDQCIPGRYTAGTGTVDCTQCPPGKANNQRGQSSCSDCLIGQAQMYPGSLKCVDCAPGSQTNSIGSPVCTSCSGGKKENGLRTGCIDCEAGKMSNPGASECDTCDHLSGYIATGAGNDQCEYCGPGFKADQTVHDCVACEPGKISIGGVDECLSCDATKGKVQSLSAQSSCDFCGAGKKAVAQTINSCVSCEIGKASLGGGDFCNPCSGNGEYSDIVGGAVCKLSPPGYIPNTDHTAIVPCPTNTFSTGATDSCLPCGNGAHCQPGSFTCVQTQPGQHYNATLQRDVNCSRGKYSSDGDRCVSCGPGFISQNLKSSHCDVCQPGYHSNEEHTQCLPCAKGKFSGAAAPMCTLCEAGKYTDNEGQSFCKLCDDYMERSTTNFEGAESGSSCFCLEGFFDNGNNMCEVVMEGVSKRVKKATLERLPLEPGYWRTTNTSRVVMSCIVAEACVGNDGAGNYCRVGHGGPYCDVCNSGYSKDVSGICQSCDSILSPASILMNVSTLLLLLIAAVIVKKKFYSKYKRQFRGLKAAFRIFFVSYQIIAVLPSIVPAMSLPENLTSSIDSLNFLKLNIFKMVSFGCLNSAINFYSQLVTMTTLPIIICLLLWIIILIMPRNKDLMGTIMLIVAYSVMPSVSTTLFGAFPCDTLDIGKRYLIVDYGIDCSSSAYKTYAIYSGLMVLVYPIGIPLVFWFLLIKKKDHINKPVAEREKDEDLFGIEFLYDNYKPNFWYFEVVVTVFRLLLTGVLGVIQPGSSTQLSVGMLMSGAAIVICCRLWPYENERDNYLSVLSYVQIFLLMLCALVIKNQDLASDSFDKENLGYVLICGNILVLVVGISLGIVQFWRTTEEGYQSDDIVAIAKRGIEQTNARSSRGNTRESNQSIRPSSFFDIFSGVKKKFMRGGESQKSAIEGWGGDMELAEIYKQDSESDRIRVQSNPMKKKTNPKAGWAIGSRVPAPELHPALTSEEVEKLGPPPEPLTFTSPSFKSSSKHLQK